ncbi:glycosyltransferase family 2 protein [Macrococcus armenti]|uniref:glycosyltransferase family 2 protein n=1 Tax=Macrococcus armenti TaxID=2875764 RepID=UPI001CCF33CE|nr:glycosyltransferase family 2 protein [Macrococcus armenti]UBH09540.1 glycosyltransferase family 2 protein [Macrococcus armenti]UBH11817.1 glycosyltransferase family 2 protein [Macrococcus armenti]UBH23265.1 glycosyltransferase family 2 protein [Macrococcus armenti]
MLISLIAPIYNEEKNIRLLTEKIDQTMQQYQYEYELILVNDGSKDDSLHIIKQQAQLFSQLKYISFSRNFGKESAMLAGLNACTGDCAIILDADLQHPPERIPEMIAYYNEGYDQVVMKRDRTGEHVIRKLPTQLFYKLINNAVDIKLTDGEGDFRLISRRVIDSILSLKEYNRFSKGIFEWIGFKKKTINFKNVERHEGTSSFSPKRLIDYAIDGIISYNNKPLRLCFHFSAVTMALCLLYILITFIQILSHGIEEPGYFTIIASVLFLGSVQLFGLGIIGEYIGRIYYETKGRPHYIICDTNINETDIQKKVRNRA